MMRTCDLAKMIDVPAEFKKAIRITREIKSAAATTCFLSIMRKIVLQGVQLVQQRLRVSAALHLCTCTVDCGATVQNALHCTAALHQV